MRAMKHGKPGKITRTIGLGIALMLVVFLIADRVCPVNTTVNFSSVVEARDGTVLHAFLAKDQQWRMQTSLSEITLELKKAIIFKEDRYFNYHPGINLLAITRAAFNNIIRRRRTSGASTITMQVARMLKPKSRTFFNKGIEMFRALQLELHFSKDEILQMYLNLVPYGSNIQGVKAASLFYFNKMPDHLSLAEITALSIIPNRPNSLALGKDNEIVVRQRNKWLSRFLQANLFPKSVIRDALAEPLSAWRHPAPAMAPQFALRMRQSYRDSLQLRTSLDYTIQKNAENIVANYVNRLKLHNINNAAVLIVDNRTHEVVSYIGSSDFNDSAHFGQVDGVCAVRSPGSTLKPLLYGLCIDKGLITPKTMIADVPTSLKGYAPENYDRMFRGNVTIEYALSHSLNIPAVKLLDNVGLDSFTRLLSHAGFASLKDQKDNIGLSLILGGCVVRLEELVTLYSSFANDGKIYPIKFVRARSGSATKEKPANQGMVVLSPEADYMLTRMLSELHRPDLPNAYDEALGIPRIAWKTGTSYARKDAWSIGYNKRYTIGVWLGNFSGMGVQELSGTSTATPLLFQLFNAIDYNATNEWLQPPANLAFRLVCSETGKVPNDFCNNQVMDYYIPGVSSNEKCDHLKEVFVSANGKYCYCTSCLPNTGYKIKLLPNISSELASYYDASHIAYTKLPPHDPNCTRAFSGAAPIITSLTNGMTYFIENREQQKFGLSCTVANDVHKVYWYINDKFFISTDAHQKAFFKAPSNLIKISCSDDKGRNSSIEIKVRFI